ncbi:hypothetical protein [Streptomyces sp. NPDC007088]|uniref:hypothetical protein n=1 Tax=Streptomyces sp. NPDC007088 TaxID=3364773 RepID=UPI0036ABA550
MTRAGHEPVATVAPDDQQALKETAYLLRSPGNARKETWLVRVTIVQDGVRIASCRCHYGS